MWDEYYAEHPDGQVIHHYLKEEWTQRAVQEPGVIFASDLLPMQSKDKKVAPRNGTFSKILARYVREEQLLDLTTALSKMTLLPAQRLEQYFTLSQFFSHFLRHVNGRSHTGHILLGKLDFFIVI